MRRTPSRASRLLAVAAAAAVTILLAGCASLSSIAATGTSVSAPAPAIPAATGHAATGKAATGKAATGQAARGLEKVHDPRKVTYSLTLKTCQFRDGGQLPDPSCTPGAIDPAVTQQDIRSTICRSGYTTTVRPPESETERAKFNVTYAAYHVKHSAKSELDHLVSLELGGANDIANLWPEVGKQPNPKDAVENALHRAVCDGQVTLAAAQQAIASDWLTAEAKLGIK